MSKKLYIVILFFLVLPSQFLMLQKKLYPSHDGLYHIGRISEFHSAILEGQFPPRLAPYLLNGIGYPLFVVNYQLPYYLSEIVLLLSSKPELAYKIVMSTTFILSSLLIFLLFRKIGPDISALTGSVVFTYLPYRFANLYTRGAFGESVAIMFIPLVLIALHLIVERKSYGFVLLSLSIFGLVTSHTLVLIIFTPFFILYSIFILRIRRNDFGIAIKGFAVGLLLSSFQLGPSLFEKRYMVFDSSVLRLFEGHFIDISQLLRIPKENINLGTPLQIGVGSTLILMVSSFLVILRKRYELLFFILFALISLFLVTTLSSTIWKNVPGFSYLLYPWRFLSVVVISVSFLAVYLVNYSKHKIILSFLIISIVIFTSRHYFLKPTQIEQSLPTDTLTTQGEFNSIWTTKETFENRQLISSTKEIEISEIKETPFSLSFALNTREQSAIILRKMFFPGWKVSLNNQDECLMPYEGLVSFNVPQGSWLVEARFTESPTRLISNLLTIASFGFLLTIFLRRRGI